MLLHVLVQCISFEEHQQQSRVENNNGIIDYEATGAAMLIIVQAYPSMHHVCVAII